MIEEMMDDFFFFTNLTKKNTPVYRTSKVVPFLPDRGPIVRKNVDLFVTYGIMAVACEYSNPPPWVRGCEYSRLSALK